MKLTFTKLALIGAVALTFATGNSQTASAQCRLAAVEPFEAQLPEQMRACALIENTFTTEVRDISYGDVGVTNALGEAGCLIMGTDGVFDEDNVQCAGRANGLPTTARVVARAASGTAGAVAIDGAFPAQEVRLHLQVANNNIVCVNGPALKLTRLFSDQAGTPATWAWNTDIATSNTAATIGAGVTDGTGDITILLGAEIQNDQTITRYESGTCEGDFTVTLFY